jgi:hypothetical protein
MMNAARKYLDPVVARLKEEFSDPSRFGQKRWLAYGGLLIISFVLFLTVGGSRKYPDAPPEIGYVDVGGTTGEMGGRLAGMGEPGLPPAFGREVPDEVPVTWETWGRDPFSAGMAAPVALPDDPAPDLALSAISWRDGEAVVLIDDFILRKGETIQGSEIVNILPGCVILERDGRRFVLRLREDG